MKLLRVFRVALPVLAVTAAVAGVIPTMKLPPAAERAFQDYVAAFEKATSVPFQTSGHLWIDSAAAAKLKDFADGKPVVEARENRDIGEASIHHFSGVIRVHGQKIESVRKIMEDYPNYPKYFKPDVSRSEGSLQPDSTPEDEHFQSRLYMEQGTLWVDVAFDARFDTHYRRLDADRWTSRSSTLSIREVLDPHHPEKGLYPEGEDHGFLWKTNTFWYLRQKDGNLEMEVDSMTLSRKVPIGFGWWGVKRTHDAVEKMLRDMKALLEAPH